jgi:hypothetical protein
MRLFLIGWRGMWNDGQTCDRVVMVVMAAYCLVVLIGFPLLLLLALIESAAA